MVPQVRPGLCQRVAPQVSSAGRPMALGRGVSQNQRMSPLPLACSRSGWRSVGYSGPEPEGQEGSQEVFSQALKGITVCPECYHYRQAKELRRGEGRSVAECRSLPRQVAEQPRGEFASANEVEGARDETGQVGRARPTLSLSLRNY